MAETVEAEIRDFVAARFRRTDEKLDIVLGELRTAVRRLTSIEDRITKLERQEGHNFGILNERLDILQSQLDTISDRLDRVARRLELADPKEEDD